MNFEAKQAKKGLELSNGNELMRKMDTIGSDVTEIKLDVREIKVKAHAAEVSCGERHRTLDRDYKRLDSGHKRLWDCLGKIERKVWYYMGAVAVVSVVAIILLKKVIL